MNTIRPYVPSMLRAVVMSSVVLLSQSVGALTFDISFDSTADGGVSPPIVGTGVFSFDGDPGDGSFAISSLSSPAFSASFGADTFVLSDTEDDLNEVLAVITTSGSNRFLNFGNVNGESGGLINGSFDLLNNTNQTVTSLSFQPGVSGGILYGASSLFGNYEAIARIPEPSTLLSIGILFVALAVLRKRNF